MRFSTLMQSATALLGLVLLIDRAAAQGCADDIYEPNDDCVSATPITVGPLFNLVMAAGTYTSHIGDYYAYTMAAGESVVFDVYFIDAVGDIDLQLYSDAACLTQVASAASVTDNETISYTNNTAGSLTVTMKVFPWSAATCVDYSINVTSTPPPVNCPGADAFEPNDTCATASALPLGLTSLLNVNSTSDADYWSYTAVNNELLTIDLLFSHAGGDIDAFLYDDAGTCVSQVSSSTSLTDNEQLTYTNISGVPVNLTMKVSSSTTVACNEYNLQVTSVVDPCVAAVDDAFSPNHDCASAVPVVGGVYPGLMAKKPGGDDFFSVSVADGVTLNMVVNFIDANGDIDCYIYDSSTLGSTCGDKTNYLARGFGVTDVEDISWTNTTGSTQTYIMQVNLWDNAANPSCNPYDLTVNVNNPNIATPMCFGDGTVGACPCGNESTLGAGEGCKSSVGVGAILTASGSASVAADDIAFSVSQARPNQTSMLLQGASLISVPFKDGNFCMGNPTERIQVVFLDATGSGSTTTSVVTEGNVVPGNTRYYQHWFRDPGGVSPCGNGSNFSNGLTVVYMP